MQNEEQELIERRAWEMSKDLGQTVKKLREYRGLTVEQAAELTGLSDKKIASIERGSLPHSITHIMRIIECLGGRLAVVPTNNPGVIHCDLLPLQSKN